MKLKPGQRWFSKDPQYVVEIVRLNSNNDPICVIVQPITCSFDLGYTSEFGSFPDYDAKENIYWIYLEGQDNPEI